MSTQNPGPSSPNPANSNLEFHRKAAKALLKQWHAHDPAALARLQPPPGRPAPAQPPRALALHDAQRMIAREAGFPSWPAMALRLRTGPSNPAQSKRTFRPHVREFQWYEERIAGVMSLFREAAPAQLERIRAFHPRFAGAGDDAIRHAAFSEDDARLLIAREHGFDDWAAFKSHVDAIAAGQVFEPFTAAFEAVKAGDAAKVVELVAAHRELVGTQGANGSSLLNLACSMRQPAICQLLIDAGADVNLATTRGVTPLHQAAYSNQADIAQLLMDAGADLDADAFGAGGTPLVMALFWGNDLVRDVLAEEGILPQNLRAAAGAGRRDLVEDCFDQQGSLTPAAGARRGFYRPHTGFPERKPSGDRQEILDEALAYAARNGQVGVMDLLLARGADINGDPYRGTPLTWAAYKSRLETAIWLLDHGAEINRQGTFGGPQHGQGVAALHIASQCGSLEMVKLLLARGADPALKDDLYGGGAQGWAEHGGKPEVQAFLRASAGT